MGVPCWTSEGELGSSPTSSARHLFKSGINVMYILYILYISITIYFLYKMSMFSLVPR